MNRWSEGMGEHNREAKSDDSSRWVDPLPFPAPLLFVPKGESEMPLPLSLVTLVLLLTVEVREGREVGGVPGRGIDMEKM